MTGRLIHVASDLGLDGTVRNMVASTFALAGNLPSVVGTGCGLRVPRADTSRLPEVITCLSCRTFAYQQYLQYADQIERLRQTPGLNITTAQIGLAANASREMARKFAETEGR